MGLRTDVSVISCIYGDTHDEFVARWSEGIRRLNPMPREVIVGSDRPRAIAWATVIAAEPSDRVWFHPQPYYLQQALDRVTSTWVWIHDIDDIAFEDALAGVAQTDADVLQCGYHRSDGEIYMPPEMTATELLEAETNPFVAGSCVRTEKLREVGGFPDVALQDWALWRRLALAGATFATSDWRRFRYMRHPATRGARELTVRDRDRHFAEMMALEEAVEVVA